MAKPVSILAMMIAAIAAIFIGSGVAQASTGWQTPDPNATTQDTPAQAWWRGHFVVVNRGGSDNALWFNHDGGPFTRIGGTTYAAPAITEFNNTLYLFQTGQDGNLYYQTMGLDGNDQPTWAWSSAHAIPGPAGTGVRVTLHPAIASSGNQLHIIAVGNNEHIYHSALYTNNAWSGSWTEPPGGGRTESGPTATTTPDGYLMVGHRGTNNLMYTQRGVISTGQWDGSWTQLPHGHTDHGFALTYDGADGRIVEAWAQDDDGDAIMTSESSTRGVDQTNAIHAADNVPSPSGPALNYEGGNGVGLAIRGSNFTYAAGNLNMYQNHIYINNAYYGR